MLCDVSTNTLLKQHMQPSTAKSNNNKKSNRKSSLCQLPARGIAYIHNVCVKAHQKQPVCHEVESTLVVSTD